MTSELIFALAMLLSCVYTSEVLLHLVLFVENWAFRQRKFGDLEICGEAHRPLCVNNPQHLSASCRLCTVSLTSN